MTAQNSYLVRGGTVLTPPGSVTDTVQADVRITDGVISEIGPHLDPSGEVLDAFDHLVVPGFVDTHRHTWQTAFRAIAADWSLAQYARGLHGVLKPHITPEDIRLANLVGRIEALDSGITTMLDWSHGIISPAHGEAAAQGLLEAPGRSVFGYAGGFGFPCDDPIEDELRHLRSTVFADDHARVTLVLALRGPQYSSLDATERDVRLARDLGLRVTVHGGSAGWGRNRPVGRMAERGLLDERTTVVHCNTLADDELKTMADVGASASVSPIVEMQMGFGWPATGRLLDVGVRPSLSIDDCAAVGGDMFRTMQVTALVQRALDNEAIPDPTDQIGLRLSSRDVVEFATIEGARACGLDGRTGTIEVGKEADLLLVRHDHPSAFPLNHPYGWLVAVGHPGLVDTVLVAGEIVKRDGRMVGVDLPGLRKALVISREAVLRRANADPTVEGPVTADGRWSPTIAGFTANAVNPVE